MRISKRSADEMGRTGRFAGAFTLIELLVTVAIMALLAGLILPTLGRVTIRSKSLHCINNTRQLTMAWLMYADDQEGWLCPNSPAAGQGWVGGVMNFDGNFPDNTNTVYLTDPRYAKLAPYVQTLALYRCPADRSTVRERGAVYPRVRSLAMNDAMGYNAPGALLPSKKTAARKINDLGRGRTDLLWVLIEQHPDSIDDGQFEVDCSHTGSSAQLVEFPSNYHGGACSVTFADGHVELHSWRDELTRPPNKYCGCLAHYAHEGYPTLSPNNVDVAWLQERTGLDRN